MPREVFKTCYYESLPIKTKDIIPAKGGCKDIGILKNLRSGGGHLGFRKIPSLQFLQTLF